MQSKTDEDNSEMSQLFQAINQGDADAVRSVCMADKSLVSLPASFLACTDIWRERERDLLVDILIVYCWRQ